MIKHFLLQDYSSENVQHIVALDTDASAKEIQDYIDDLNEQWLEWEENDDGTLGDDCEFNIYASQGEYVLDNLNYKFNGITIDPSDVLYY